MKLLLATTNPGKLREIRTLMRGIPIDLVALSEWPDVVAPAETGHTFEENARLKARYYAGASGLLTVAEDSGLEIEALDGAPGVESARLALELFLLRLGAGVTVGLAGDWSVAIGTAQNRRASRLRSFVLSRRDICRLCIGRGSAAGGIPGKPPDYRSRRSQAWMFDRALARIREFMRLRIPSKLLFFLFLHDLGWPATCSL